jgi:hypothetical protein
VVPDARKYVYRLLGCQCAMRAGIKPASPSATAIRHQQGRVLNYDGVTARAPGPRPGITSDNRFIHHNPSSCRCGRREERHHDLVYGLRAAARRF